MNTTHTKAYAELARIAGTFGKWEKTEFLNYIWSTEFAEWDAIAPTDEAVKMATDLEKLAAYVWAKEKE